MTKKQLKKEIDILRNKIEDLRKIVFVISEKQEDNNHLEYIEFERGESDMRLVKVKHLVKLLIDYLGVGYKECKIDGKLEKISDKNKRRYVLREVQ